MRPRRILLIRRKALGDALVTLPAVIQVAAAWPDARVDLVIDRPFVPLFADLARGLRVLAWPPPREEHWLLSLRRRSYDLIIDWLGSPRTAMWTGLSGARWRVGYDLPGRRWAYNLRVPRNIAGTTALRGFAGEAFLDPLRELGMSPPPWHPELEPASQESGLGSVFREWLASGPFAGRRPVVLMMSATWSAKSWPAVHAAQLFRDLEANGRVPMVVTGPGDADLETALRRELPPTAFAPPTNLPELARLLHGARLFVGTDNGARHLAAGLGVPTVTLFGPTDPGGWNPPGPRHVSVMNPVPCSPCDLTECPVPGHPCLDALAPAKVLGVVEELLTNHDRRSAGRASTPIGRPATEDT